MYLRRDIKLQASSSITKETQEDNCKHKTQKKKRKTFVFFHQITNTKHVKLLFHFQPELVGDAKFSTSRVHSEQQIYQNHILLSVPNDRN